MPLSPTLPLCGCLRPSFLVFLHGAAEALEKCYHHERQLLDHGADIGPVLSPYPLRIAIRHKFLEVVQLLVELNMERT